jgi:uncharacterized glyoxalase superfamily protein PhnB
MTAPAHDNRPTLIPSVIYKDNRAALEWLRDAFGFEVSHLLLDSNGNVVHAEMTHDDGIVMISNEWVEWAKSPASIGGKNTQRIHVHLKSGIDEHCEHARKAGAKIVMEPQDQFYGDRTYVAQDHEGHHWTFAQTVRVVPWDEMGESMGLRHADKL